MGYYMDMTDCKFHIPASKFGAALQAIKDIMFENDDMHGGAFAGGQMVERWYSWVNTDAVMMSDTLEQALAAWRWRGYTDANGDIDYLRFEGEKSGQDNALFRVLAPYVTEGSYVAMRGEDGALWRWYFDGNRCIEQEGRVVYK
jgi:hypothetical protein